MLFAYIYLIIFSETKFGGILPIMTFANASRPFTTTYDISRPLYHPPTKIPIMSARAFRLSTRDRLSNWTQADH